MPGAIIVNPDNNCSDAPNQTKYYQGALLDFFSALNTFNGGWPDYLKEKFAALFVVQVAKLSYVIGSPQYPLTNPTQYLANGTNTYQFPAIEGKDVFIFNEGIRILQNATGYSRTGRSATISFAFDVTDANIEILAIEPFSADSPYLPYQLPYNLLNNG